MDLWSRNLETTKTSNRYNTENLLLKLENISTMNLLSEMWMKMLFSRVLKLSTFVLS